MKWDFLTVILAMVSIAVAFDLALMVWSIYR
jgi:uncharacterized membrane protein